MKKIIHVNASTPYDITLAEGLLHSDIILQQARALANRFVIITDRHVAGLYAQALAEQLDAQLIILPAGERYKTREQKIYCEDQMLAAECGRDTCIIAVGGGVVTDMAGFIAATYCRGIPVIYVPTTLLAMVDAAIGGKTAVNTPLGKNLIGAFKQPHAVFIDVTTLRTLPLTERLNGIVETIKHALISDHEFFNALRDNLAAMLSPHYDFTDMIYRSIHIKRHIVENDETEHGQRLALNLGHTLGHALELHFNYKISHGHAVALGIMIEGHAANLLGILNTADLQAIIQTLQQLPFKQLSLTASDYPCLLKHMVIDKKSQQHIPQFVLLESIGKIYQKNGMRTPIDKAILIAALEKFTQQESLSC